jgi:hypothetical protein
MTLTGFAAIGFLLLPAGLLVGLIGMCWLECKYGNPDRATKGGTNG